MMYVVRVFWISSHLFVRHRIVFKLATFELSDVVCLVRESHKQIIKVKLFSAFNVTTFTVRPNVCRPNDLMLKLALAGGID